MLHLLLALLLLFAASAEATTYYVDSATGNDANTGLSEGAAWATVLRSMGRVGGGGPTNGAGPGDTVFIKNGTYNRAYTPSSSYDPCYYPVNNGTAGNPIVYRNFTGHSPVLTCNEYGFADDQGSPTLGGVGKSYITYIGLSLLVDSKQNVMVVDSDNLVFDAITIDRTPRGGAGGTGNYYCFFLQTSRYITIKNSLCRDSYTAADIGDGNAGGIVNFSTRNILAQFNNFINVGTCLDDKEGGQDDIWEFNYCVSNNGASRGAQVTAFNAVSRCGAWNCSVQRITFRYNIFRGDGVSTGQGEIGLNLSAVNAGSQDNRDIYAYGNTIYRMTAGIRTVNPIPGVRFYNNIVHMAGTGSQPYAHRHGTVSAPDNHPPLDMVTNRNCYQRGTGSLEFNASETGGAGIESFATWQSTGASDHPGVAFDVNSLNIASGTTIFTGASSTPGVVGDFTLDSGSACNDLARSNHDGTGATFDAGAFGTSSTPGIGGEAAPPGSPPTISGTRIGPRTAPPSGRKATIIR